MNNSHIHPEDFGQLIEAGFLAVKQGSRTNGRKIFEAAYQLRPDHSASMLGFGYMALSELQLPMARQIFEAVLQKEPKNAMAKVLLGFSFLMERFQQVAGRKKGSVKTSPTENADAVKRGEALIHEALKETQDEGVKRLGESALELSTKVNAYIDVPLKK